MATTAKEIVKVDQLTQYGLKSGDVYYNWSKKCTDQAKVFPGATMAMMIYTADSGKKYINSVVNEHVTLVEKPVVTTEPPVTDVNPPVDQERAKKFNPKFEKKGPVDNSMSKADWAAKDRSQLIGGLSHDAAALTAALIPVSGDLADPRAVLDVYTKILDGLLKIREVVK